VENASIQNKLCRQQKDDAERAVKGIKGIGEITNNIEVLPVSPMDDQIRRAEYRAIDSFPLLQPYSTKGAGLDSRCREGRSRELSRASLRTKRTRLPPAFRAKTVPNVFSVTDNLPVESGGNQKADTGARPSPFAVLDECPPFHSGGHFLSSKGLQLPGALGVKIIESAV